MSSRGLSMIEILLGLGIMTVTIVIYTGSLATVRMVRDSRDQVQAYRIASRQLEILRSTDFAALPASGTIVDSNLNNLPSGSGSYTVGDYPGSVAGRLKQAQVTVTWVDNGVNKQVQISTLITETGFNP